MNGLKGNPPLEIKQAEMRKRWGNPVPVATKLDRCECGGALYRSLLLQSTTYRLYRERCNRCGSSLQKERPL